MQQSKNIFLNEYLLVFMFCMAVITGPAISVLFENDLSHFPDCKTYLGLAHFDFFQSPVRRYRVIVPFAAAVVNFLFGPILAKFSPSYFTSDYSLSLSFFLVNMALMSYFGLLIYRYCKAFGLNRVFAIVGTLVMLTCRYTIYTAAYPLVDSLFCVVIAMTLTGIKEKNTSLLIFAVFLGPFAKEAFIFIAPLILFFSGIDKKKLVLYFLLSGMLVFVYRYLYDLYAPLTATGSLKADMNHLPNLIRNLPKLFSPYTFFKILMNTGLWILVPLPVLFISISRSMKVIKRLDSYLAWFFLSVIVQMLLSGSMERMFYLAMPVICVIVALFAEEIQKIYIRHSEITLSETS